MAVLRSMPCKAVTEVLLLPSQHWDFPGYPHLGMMDYVGVSGHNVGAITTSPKNKIPPTT